MMYREFKILNTPLLWITIIIFVLIYKLIFKNWNFFKTQKIRFHRDLPIFGFTWKFLTQKQSLVELSRDMYEMYPKEKIIGFYAFSKPIYLLRDPELINRITIRDFDHFTDRVHNFDDSIDPIFGRGLYYQKNHRWKNMRTTMGPAFSGEKMQEMYSLIAEYTVEFLAEIKTDQYNMKDLSQRFANDIIATFVFGFKMNSLKERKNRFFLSGLELANFNAWKGVKYMLYRTTPKVMKTFRIKIFPAVPEDFFRKMVCRAVNYRNHHKICRPDFVQILVDSQNIRDWETEDMVGQCLTLFLSSFDTITTVLTFLSYELAMNPKIQQQLYEEILTTESNLNGKPLTCDILMSMKYMDAVLSETLRRWSPTPITERAVTKPYHLILTENDPQKVKLNIGDSIWIPIYSLHMDRNYFSDPERFDPDRFNDVNRKTIVNGTFIPFGSGPRMCIGSKLALMQCKLYVYKLLLKFSLERCDRTQHPFKLKYQIMSMTSDKDFWLQLRSR